MGKKWDTFSNIATGIGAVGYAIFGEHYVKPNWMIKYEQNDWLIQKKTGLSDKKIREIYEVLMEYEVLEREGKKY